MNSLKYLVTLTLAFTGFLSLSLSAETLTKTLPDYDLTAPELARPEEPIGAPSLPYVKSAALFAESWPKMIAENFGTTTCSGVETLQIKVTPFRWQGGKLEALRNGKVEVEVEGDLPRSRLKMAEAPTRPRYVLISPSAYTEDWADYLAMRRTQRPDVDFVLKNAAEIYRDYPFDPAAVDGASRNPAESIHAWIRETMKDVPTEDRLSDFASKVTIKFSTGSATVVAGVDTIFAKTAPARLSSMRA